MTDGENGGPERDRALPRVTMSVVTWRYIGDRDAADREYCALRCDDGTRANDRRRRRTGVPAADRRAYVSRHTTASGALRRADRSVPMVERTLSRADSARVPVVASAVRPDAGQVAA